ncbi:MAG: hypothetical protein OXI01_01220 [Albidovulum sp.]|nr:hypothetical protein [Albidovulum sp.]
MDTDDFRAFVDALESTASAPEPAPTEFERVSVLGAGPESRLLACLFLAEGAEVVLYSPYSSELAAIRKAGGITLRGAGPVGTFQIDRDAGPCVRLSSEIDASVEGADLIVIAGPVLRQRAAAFALTQLLEDGQVLAIVPGRTFGALEIAWMIRSGGCRSDIALVETQGLPYWIAESGNILNLKGRRPVAAAVLPASRTDALRGLMRFLPDLVPCQNVAQSSFADGSAIAEVPALLIGGPAAPSGALNLPAGAEPLPERNTFRALLGSRHNALASALAEERRRVAARWGVRELPDCESWLDAYAGDPAGDLSRPVPGPEDADILVRCAVVGSLMPLLSAARIAGVKTPATMSAATLAEASLGGGLAAAGRRLQSLGMDDRDIDDARRVMDALSKGLN